MIRIGSESERFRLKTYHRLCSRYAFVYHRKQIQSIEKVVFAFAIDVKWKWYSLNYHNIRINKQCCFVVLLFWYLCGQYIEVHSLGHKMDLAHKIENRQEKNERIFNWTKWNLWRKRWNEPNLSTHTHTLQNTKQYSLQKKWYGFRH